MNLRRTARPFDRDLLRYAEGSMSDSEMAPFEARLASEPALRKDLRDLAEQAFAIGEHARNAEAMSEIANRSGIIALPQNRRASWKIHLPWAAAAALVISAVTFFFTRESPPMALVEVLEVSGTASWISEDGARTVVLEKGMRLPAGALELSSESGLARLRYDDGSTLTFTGFAEAVITKKSGKSLRMKHGQLTANVSPQEAGAAMRIATPTAEVTIVGTQFSLNVEEGKTGLGVFEGMVRMRRLTDGKEQDVPTGFRLTSTLEARAEFVPTALLAVEGAWTSDFTRMPDITQGEWMPPGEEHPLGAIAARALVAERKPDGSIITHYGIILTSEPGFVALRDDSILRLKVRVKTAAAMQFMLSTRMPDSTYTGNFEANPIPLQPGAWQDIEIPISRLKALKYAYPTIPSGAMAHAFIITTYQEDEGLEIARISLQSSE